MRSIYPVNEKSGNNVMKKKYRLNKWFSVLFIAVLFPAVLYTALLINNHIFFIRPTRDHFVQRLEHSMEAGSAYITARFEDAAEGGNAALYFMVNDMVELSDNPDFKKIVDDYTSNSSARWRKLVDQRYPFKEMPEHKWKKLEQYHRWIAFSLSNNKVALTSQDLADMYDAEKFTGYDLTHQLLALMIHKRSNPFDDKLEILIGRVCERIAQENAGDFRVTDLYVERVAFLFMAGRSDLVRGKWVWRILSNQQDDGGWKWTWYGLNSGWFNHQSPWQGTNAHTTTMAVWAAYMIQYRYPTWIETWTE